MELLEKLQLPASQAEDINPDCSVWRNGRLVSLDEGDFVSLYIAHEDGVIDEPSPEAPTEEGGIATRPRPVVWAQHIRVRKPLTRDMAINAAEMSAYNLADAMAVASFNASLARKSRLNPDDPEVVEHDRFIGWVRACLTEIGV